MVKERVRHYKKELSLDESLSLIKGVENVYEGVNDFVATVIRQERTDGRLFPKEEIFVKFMKPYSIYLKWIGNVHKGREALYVEGKNNNKIVAHEGGFFGIITLTIDPYSSLAMWGNRHPITELGFGTIINIAKKDINQAIQINDKDYKYYERGEYKIFGKYMKVYERIAPKDKKDIYYSYKFVSFVDKEYHLPLIIANWDFDNKLMEKFMFKEIKINVGLTEKDFDPKNKEYRF